MANTSCEPLARELLRYCLDGRPWPPPLLHHLVGFDCSKALFRLVVEPLADRFEPRLCDTYAALFSETIAQVLPEYDAAFLYDRFQRVRRVRACDAEPVDVFVLSRVTLGADIKVTSVLLEAVKRRFPNATIHLAGGRKSAELFAADGRIQHLLVEYPRSGSLRDRMMFRKELEQRFSTANSIVIDPDSRLTQLGLLPVCAEENYFFFESRAYGGDGSDDLATLTARWAGEVFGIENCEARLAPAARVEVDCARPLITVSLGVGDNRAKRIGGDFESKLLTALGRRAATLWIDKGAGGEEAARVETAVAEAGLPRESIRIWDGSFAGFASIIAQSDLYAGYDSAGQHAAAASGVPLLTIFAGHVSRRAFDRWRPVGRGRIEIVRVEDDTDRANVIGEVEAGLGRLLQGRR